MYYYSHNIGDFNRETRHLTRMERSVYRDLIDLYYETELPLTPDLSALCRKILARSNEESTAVEQVLNEFFIKTPDGWFHSGCDEGIQQYRTSNSQKSAAGKASAAAKAARKQQALNGISTVVETSVATVVETDVERASNGSATKQEPVNVNQEPVNKKHKAPAAADAELFPGVDPKVVADFKKLRKAKSAPVTETAMQDIAAEATKAGMTLEAALRVCCTRGWQGFKASWVLNADGDRRAAPRAAGNNDKFNVAGLDHSSSRAAMEASMRQHGIAPAAGDEEIEI